ncbi:hypothetical protein FACS1894139_03800 [Planctomycetales bacterium]|nr:hypothetical protein FACS1894107_14150 [Planctomycetales bacterium]GHS97669.1 hypothetical protein FACS1894108_04430 [Planctomycetales bacterium]GHT03465.1 hypothetical protein FACS1894139_03800 [Planctomycetales bacterium]GHV19090.1 hypothetical protein AGMMS49959_02930 [Planctomycetales bacterium]
MAKKFKFKLEAMLKYRQMLEDGKKREFALANAAVAEKHRQAEALSAERADLVESLRGMTANGAINMQTLTGTIRSIGNLEMGAASARQEEEKMRAAMEGVRQAFIGARRDKRVVELLKEKKQTAHRQAVEKETQKELEEISLRVLGKKSS